MEDWVSWIVRATGVADAERVKAGIEDWSCAQRRRYWRWAGHVARRQDGRWSALLLTWLPCHGQRNLGRPLKRWADDLDSFFKRLAGLPPGSWIDYAADRGSWTRLEDDFVHAVHLE